MNLIPPEQVDISSKTGILAFILTVPVLVEKSKDNVEQNAKSQIYAGVEDLFCNTGLFWIKNDKRDYHDRHSQ